VKFQVRDYQGALDDLSRALLLNDQSADAWLNRGRVYFWLNQGQSARSDWEKAARLGSTEAEALLEKVKNTNADR
jgi:tetratricopeptide (TPR) repeat protein